MLKMKRMINLVLTTCIFHFAGVGNTVGGQPLDVCLYAFQVPQCSDTGNGSNTVQHDLETLKTLENSFTGPQAITSANCPAPGADPPCCMLPFTYNNQLYYQCIEATPGSGNYGCFFPGRIWTSCGSSPGYTATNQTISLTIPTFDTPIPVISVNYWIVFQQRMDNSVNFNRSWSDYKTGFGVYNGNYWMGLEKVYQLCNDGSCKLRIEILLTSGQWHSDEYQIFFLDNELANYKIHMTRYAGDGEKYTNPTNSNGMLNGMSFSTFDRDNDLKYGVNCALSWVGGWWYNNCFWMNLNGNMNNAGFSCNSGVTRLLASRMMLKLV